MSTHPTSPSESARPSGGQTPSASSIPPVPPRTTGPGQPRQAQPARGQASSVSGEQITQSSTPPAASTRTVYRTSRPVVRLGLPDGWLRASLAGLSAALLGWALATSLVLTTYMAVADSPWLGSVSWPEVMAAGASLWAMSLGGTLRAPLGDEATVLLRAVPLALTFMSVAGVRVFVRSSRGLPVTSYFFAVPAFVGTVAVFVAANRAWIEWPSTLLGATVISTVGVAWAWGVERRHTDESLLGDLLPQWWPSLLRGIRAGLLTCAGVGAVAGLVLVVATVAYWPTITRIGLVIEPGQPVDVWMLVAAQLVYVPNAVVWTAVWLSGAGLEVGTGAWHSLTVVTPGPIPPIPLLGVLPVTAPGWGWVLLPVCGALSAGVVWGMRAQRGTFTQDAVSAGLLVVTQAAVLGCLTTASVLVLGQGRLTHVGPHALTATLSVVGGSGVMVCLGWLASHPSLVHMATGKVGGSQPAAVQGVTSSSAADVDATDQAAEEDTKGDVRGTADVGTLEANAEEVSADDTSAAPASAEDTLVDTRTLDTMVLTPGTRDDGTADTASCDTGLPETSVFETLTKTTPIVSADPDEELADTVDDNPTETTPLDLNETPRKTEDSRD